VSTETATSAGAGPDGVRRAVRGWLAAGPVDQAAVDAAWLCADWPVEHGGRGFDVEEHEALLEELVAAGAPTPSSGFGPTLVGPTIIRWGTERQQRDHLPGIRAGTTRWCQGFSEPSAGSDLASLRTTAVRDGDEWRIDGQKVWTTEAFRADYVFVLCRTDATVPKHRGISYLLCPMRQPGIEVRRIRQIDGGAEFCELHFDDARCDADEVVGGIGNGWTVAMTTLGFERGASEATGHRRFVQEMDMLIDLARRTGRHREPAIRQRLARGWCGAQILRMNELRASATTTAIHKMFWSEHHREVMELAIDLLGMEGQVLLADGREAVVPGYGPRVPAPDYPCSVLQSSFFFSRAETIWGGTAEIQRNIVAERVLGLPKEPAAPAG
jgi:alkylation response protein AidB-like acyl-CoA dehydrogenase